MISQFKARTLVCMKHRGSYLHILNQSDSHEPMANVYSIGGLSGLCSNIVIAWNKGGDYISD